jgi:hypothetical protein
MDKIIQKEIAVRCLEMLDIYKPYIRKFKSKEGIPCFFENYAGFYADQEEKLWNKIKEIESERGYIVYAVTHEILNFGETWSMLCVPQNTELKDVLDRINSQEFYAFAYVWNETNDLFSEAGDIAVRAAYGGIKRIT